MSTGQLSTDSELRSRCVRSFKFYELGVNGTVLYVITVLEDNRGSELRTVYVLEVRIVRTFSTSEL